MDKIGRNGLRVGDILAPDFLVRYNTLKEQHIEYLRQYDFEYDPMQNEAEWLEAVEYLRSFNIVDSEYLVNDLLNSGKTVLAEGAQGLMLDIDFGSYPFVTSSSTACAGACIGLGVSPKRVSRVYGIFKAYCTRVGSGPFPTEIFDEKGEELRRRGFEFGATTGRPRRTGWLDLVALKYAIMINGVTDLIMMKSDVLDTFDTIKVATSYIVDGQKYSQVPYDSSSDVTPVYREFPGWKRDLTGIREEGKLPHEFISYVQFIEQETGIPIKIISIGPDRDQTIIR